MRDLDFDSWEKEGNPIEGRKLPKYQDLFAHPVHKFSNSNILYNVPVDTARRSAWPGSATIISGTMYSGLV